MHKMRIGRLALSTGLLVLISLDHIHARLPGKADTNHSRLLYLRSESPVVKPQLIAHKRRHHPHRNCVRSIKSVNLPISNRTLYSLNFFRELQLHLGLTLGTISNRTTTTSTQPQSRKVKQRNVRPEGIGGGATGDTEDMLPMGYPWYANSHVPFRYRYKYSSYYVPATKAQAEDLSVTALRSIDPCILSRWNSELPFSELPNLVAKMLASDMISGETTAAKARELFRDEVAYITDYHNIMRKSSEWYLSDLLQQSLDSYVRLDSSGDVFEVPAGIDLAKCNIMKSEDPLPHSITNLLKLYSDESSSTDFLSALVKAAKGCLGKEDQPFPLELIPCLDFSFGSDQVLKLSMHSSIFGNAELCRQYLNPVLDECLPVEPHPCSTTYVESLNKFARIFYQCPEIPVEKQLSVSMANKIGTGGGVGDPAGAGTHINQGRPGQCHFLSVALVIALISNVY